MNLNSFVIKKIDIKGFSIPFSQSVETTWSKRSGTTSFLVEMTTASGVCGYGEMVAFFPMDICWNALCKAAQELKGQSVIDVNVLRHRVLYGGGWMRTGTMNDLGAAVWATLEMAMLDCQARIYGVNISQLFGGRLHQRIPVVPNVPVGDFHAMADYGQKLITRGHRRLFTKVAKHNSSLNEDLLMLETIQKKVGAKVSLHVDVNGAWRLPTALSAIKQMECRGLNLSCLEQPVLEEKGLISLRKKSPFPLGVNELLSSPQAVMRCAVNGVADVFILDMYEVGGLSALWYIAKYLTDADFTVVCRAHGGSALGYIAALQIMSAVHGAPGPHQFYDNSDEEDLVRWDAKLKDGTVELPQGNGIGLNPDLKMLKEFSRRFKSGETFSIYANKNRAVVPNFPKY